MCIHSASSIHTFNLRDNSLSNNRKFQDFKKVKLKYLMTLGSVFTVKKETLMIISSSRNFCQNFVHVSFIGYVPKTALETERRDFGAGRGKTVIFVRWFVCPPQGQAS